jgi:sulfur-carrier protein adenylyltransferase/sulfurtransferase
MNADAIPKLSRDALRWLRAPLQTSGSDAAISETRDPLLVDVRSPEEFAAGHLEGAQNYPLPEIEQQAAKLEPDLRRQIVLYCGSGERARRGAQKLIHMGYTRVFLLTEGYEEVVAKASPERPVAQARYSRQVALPQLGASGQEQLANTRVLLVGLGGLGSPVALYLAAAGVGTLGLSDGDTVELSNLHRQILHSTGRVGRGKADSAKTALRELNPGTSVVTHGHADQSLLDESLAVPGGYDIIVDGTDNLEARYLVSDAAFAHGTPVVHGSVFRFEGMVTTLMPRAAASARALPRSACYRCIFPPIGKSLTVSCADAGVLGAICGVVGSLMATEVLKLALGIGEPLIGSLLLYDGLTTRFTRVRSSDTCPH